MEVKFCPNEPPFPAWHKRGFARAVRLDYHMLKARLSKRIKTCTKEALNDVEWLGNLCCVLQYILVS